MMGGMEGMPAGAVAMGGMKAPEMPSSDYFSFVEYNFVKPIRYSGHRITTSSHDAGADPKDWTVFVDVVNMDGERGEQNLEIQSVTNAIEQGRECTRIF